MSLFRARRQWLYKLSCMKETLNELMMNMLYIKVNAEYCLHGSQEWHSDMYNLIFQLVQRIQRMQASGHLAPRATQREILDYFGRIMLFKATITNMLHMLKEIQTGEKERLRRLVA